MIVVSDASPLIELAKIGQLDLLERLFGHVFIPDAVWREVVTEGYPPVSEQVPQRTWIQTTAVDANMTLDMPLDEGEAQAIVLAAQMGSDYVLLDERHARGIARQYDVPVIGTLGILLIAKEDDLIDAVMPLVDAMVGNKFRISEELYAAVKAQAGE